MPNLEPNNLGKLILLVGIIISITGLLIIVLNRFGILRLPGDINLEGKTWKIYFPIVSCIIISVILTLVFWIINYLRK